MASALSNRQNCACARKTLQTQRGRTHGTGCVRQWFRTAEPLGECRYENWNTHTQIHHSGEPGLVDRVLALHAGSRWLDFHREHMAERFFRSNRSGYPHPVSSELENSGIRVAVGDCSVTERRRWCPPYQTGKTVHLQAKHYKHNEDGRTAPGVCGNGSVPLSHSGNVVTRIEIHIHTVRFIYSGEPGLLDRVVAMHARSRAFDSHRGHMSERFFRSNRPGYPHPVSSELENSGIRGRLMIAVSLNVGGGVRLIKPAKLCMCTQNTSNTTRTDARRRVCVAMVPYR